MKDWWIKERHRNGDHREKAIQMSGRDRDIKKVKNRNGTTKKLTWKETLSIKAYKSIHTYIYIYI